MHTLSGKNGNNKGVIGRAIERWQEKRQAKRAFSAFLDSAYTGGSLTARTMRKWLPTLGAPNTDYSEGTQKTLVSRCRDAYRNQSLARAAVDRLKHNVVGTGLKLQSKIDYEAVGISQEEAATLQRQIEREFSAWSSSQECDIERELNFTSLQALTLVSWLISGDVFVNLPTFSRPGSDYALKVQVIEGDRVSNPNYAPDTERMRRGVTLSRSGAPLVYHVQEAHPGDHVQIEKQYTWRRMRAFGTETGRRRMLHVKEKERPGQVRGVPFLAPILEPLKQLARYSEAEITAAVIAGFLSVFIKTEGGWGLPSSSELTDTEQDANQITLDSGAIIALEPGEDIGVVNPARPNSGYDMFVEAVTKEIGAALGLPADFLRLSFNTSYSAARAAILQAWKLVMYHRKIMIDYFCQPIYEIFVDEMVARGRLQVSNYADNAVRRAYTRAVWIGPARGAIDETKEIKGAALRIEAGVSTIQREAEELTGQDWQDVHDQRVIERNARKDAGLEQVIEHDKEGQEAKQDDFAK